MLQEEKGFFNQESVRKILNQFWLSIKDVYTTLRVKKQQHNTNITTSSVNTIQPMPISLNDIEINKLSHEDEIILKNNFYIRLEIVARGRYVYEAQNLMEQSIQPLTMLIASGTNFSSNGQNSSKNLTPINYNQFPIH